jgi:hypothetical protein
VSLGRFERLIEKKNQLTIQQSDEKSPVVAKKKKEKGKT